MPRIKNKQNGIPHDWQVLHPEAGMERPYRYPSFDGCVTWEIRFRKGNPDLCARFGWTTDVEEVERYVEEQNVQRMIANGWNDFIEFDGESPPKTSRQPVLPHALAAVAGHLDKIGSAKNLMVQWLGDGLEPVPIELAEKRAAICAGCPKNSKNNGETEETLWQRFTNVAANQIKGLINIKNNIHLQTTRDKELGHCEGCDCVLNLKIHAPVKHIEANTHHSVWPNLAPNCWLFSETGRTPS
jgi:hypothetical protein